MLEQKSSFADQHVPLRQFLSLGESLNINLVDFLLWLINDTDRRTFFSAQCGIIFSSRRYEGGEIFTMNHEYE
jgi:hypothetical protein